MTEKLLHLKSILLECESVCIGYSGGVDSVFLARFAVDVLGPEHMLAVTGISPAVPQVQLDVARGVARDFGIPHLEVDTLEFEDPNYTSNPVNRCYFCKSELWVRLSAVAAEHNLRTVLDGSNADDATDYRPGMQAARERAVRSPLLEAGLTKAEIREESRALGLPTWEQPSAPCLSSRLAYGVSVTRERLGQVERAEAALRALGYREFRVRHHGDCARVEFASAELPVAARRWREAEQATRDAGFSRVLLDVDGYRRGALNAAVPLIQLGAAR